MAYRCVTASGGNINGEKIICIGNDENQGGNNYNDLGIWCDFTFEEIPQVSEELALFVEQNDFQGSLLKVENGVVVLRTLEELQSELN